MLGEYIYYNVQDLKRFAFKHPKEVVKLPPDQQGHGRHWFHIQLNDQTMKGEGAKDIINAFHLDRLTWEDIIKGDHLPKIEVDDHRIFIVGQLLHFNSEKTQLIRDQVSLLIENNQVMTFVHGANPVFEVVFEKLKINRNGIRERGEDYLLYSLMGAMINLHFDIFESIENKMDNIESLVMRQSKGNYIHDLYKIRKEIMKVKGATAPIKEMIRVLLYDTKFIAEDNRAVFMDLNDRIYEINESLAYYRELVNALYDMHLSNASNRMNRIMTTLTVYSAIFIPLTFMAGVYGMNFKYMPELNQPLAYPIFWLVCIVITASMISYFKRKKWL